MLFNIAAKQFKIRAGHGSVMWMKTAGQYCLAALRDPARHQGGLTATG